MVQEYYSLEEAARALGVGSEELKAMAQRRDIRAFSDRGTWKFRKPDIEEAARQRGLGSSSEIPLSGVKSEGDLMDFDVNDLGLESSIRPSTGSKSAQTPGDSGADQILLSDENLGGAGGSRLGSSTIIGGESARKSPSDSDVRLVPQGAHKGLSDSDVQLVTHDSKSDSDVKLVGSSMNLSPSGSDVKLVDPSLNEANAGNRGANKPSDTKVGMQKPPAAGRGPTAPESDFDLGPLGPTDTATDADVNLGATPLPGELAASSSLNEPEIFLGGPSDSDITGSLASASGINLGSPADSGISLESPPNLGGASNIGLAPLDEDAAKPAAKKPSTVAKPAKPVTGVRPTPATGPGASDSGKDIFETDFEVPVIEDTDETMQLEAGSSDFELSSHPDADADSASQVFALDEDAEDVDPATKTALGSGIATIDEDEDDAAASSSGFGGSGIGGSSVGSGIMEADLEDAPASSGAIPAMSGAGGLVTTRAEAEWGGLWVGLLAVATTLTILIAFVMFDLVHNMWTWHSDYPIAGGLIEVFRGIFGLGPK